MAMSHQHQHQHYVAFAASFCYFYMYIDINDILINITLDMAVAQRFETNCVHMRRMNGGGKVTSICCKGPSSVLLAVGRLPFHRFAFAYDRSN